MIQIILLNLLLTLPLLAQAQSAFPQVDGKCPWRTMKSGDYCVPYERPYGGSQSYIVKQGNSCPYGYFESGAYCRKSVGDKPESIPREPGKDCPYKWHKAGDYCWKGE